MKKQIVLIAAAFAALFAVSCTKETPVENTPVQGGMREVTITASVDQETKTAYDAAGAFSWHKGDQISVMGTDKIFYTLTAQSSGASTTFRGMVPEGVTLRQEAFFPANPNIRRDGDSYFFTIAETKDLTATGSADIPMGSYSGTETYQFKHMMGAALFTFTNFPSNIVAAEVTFESGYSKLNGEVQVYTDGDLWTWWAKDINAEKTDGKYIRKVSVTNGQAQVYLPFGTSNGGKIWNELAVKVVGYAANGKETVLLNTETANPAFADAFERAVVKKVAPLALSDIYSIDWNATNVTVGTPSGGFTDFRAVVKGNVLYARVCAATSLVGDKFYCYVGQGEGDVSPSWAWTTKVASMVCSPELSVDKVLNEVDGENQYWYLEFPLTGVESVNSVYLGFMLYGGGSSVANAPAQGGDMLEVPLQ